VEARATIHPRQLALPFEAAPPPASPAPAPARPPPPPPDAAAAAALRDAFFAAFGRPVRLVLTANRSTMVSLSRRTNPPTLRVHRLFLGAPAHVVKAIAAYLRRGDRRAARTLDAYIRAHRPPVPPAAARPVRLRHAGKYFHLGRLFADLNARYFAGRVQARITWGLAGKRGSRRTIKLGSFARDEHLIRIHPLLDRAFVPRFFVESIVHHEMVHALVEAPLVRGRRRHHNAEFRRLERTFTDHARALAWERQNLNRLLQRRA